MYETILFDVDGVLLSEERYFDASALTVYEILCSSQYLGFPMRGEMASASFRCDLTDSEIRLVRAAVFADDAVFETMKSRGINANWDMVYLQTAFLLSEVVRECVAATDAPTVANMLQAWTSDGWGRETLASVGKMAKDIGVQPNFRFSAFCEEFRAATNKASLFKALDSRLEATFADAGVNGFSHAKTLWTLCQETFQEWYLGDSLQKTSHQLGKRGFLSDEIPIVAPEELTRLLENYLGRGIKLGIATGRTRVETEVPLEALGWMRLFDPLRVTTSSEVLSAEASIKGAMPLAKPHPFCYLSSYLGLKDTARVLNFPLPLPIDEGKKMLIVGDSVADLLAARALGSDFAAVLTGLSGAGARAEFERLNSDYILQDVLELSNIV